MKATTNQMGDGLTSKRTYRYAGFEGGRPTTTTPDEVAEIYRKMIEAGN